MKKVELEVLFFLSYCGEHNTAKDIHYQLTMNKGHISQAVTSLCQRHMIIAIPDEEDRRYVHYKVSDSAREIVIEMRRNRERISQQILEGISEEELKQFKEVAAKIAKNIENLT